MGALVEGAGLEGQALVEGAGLGPWLRCWVWGAGAGWEGAGLGRS